MDERVKTKTEPVKAEEEFDDRLENELADSFPASDPPSLTQPSGVHKSWANQKKSEPLDATPNAAKR
jgi:hypothetical protein